MYNAFEPTQGAITRRNEKMLLLTHFIAESGSITQNEENK